MHLATSRCLLLGKPSTAACQRLHGELKRLGLAARLADDFFAPTNWHQSLSDRFEDEPLMVEQLRGAGRKISARAVKFRMDRVESQPGPDGTHWAFRPDRTPEDFVQLLKSVGAATFALTGRKPAWPSAHLTISYWASEHLRRMVQIEPVEWLLDEVLLVRGGGRPYHYELIDSWRLQAPRLETVGEQLPLF